MSQHYLYDNTATVNQNTWLPIPDHKNYEINLNCEIRHIKTKRAMKVRLQKSKKLSYLTSSLGLVHRLLMSAVLGEPIDRKLDVRHLNGNSLDNSVSNLAVGSRKENNLDKLKTDTWGWKLNIAEAIDIIVRFNGRNAKLLADEFNVSETHIKNIGNGSRWSILSDSSSFVR